MVLSIELGHFGPDRTVMALWLYYLCYDVQMEQIPVHKYGILTSRAADVQKLSTSAFSGLFSF